MFKWLLHAINFIVMVKSSEDSKATPCREMYDYGNIYAVINVKLMVFHKLMVSRLGSEKTLILGFTFGNHITLYT